MRISLGPTRQLGDPAALWQTLDASPFDAVYLADHAASGLPDPWTMLAHAAALTSRIKLGTHVVGAPFHHPTRLATQVATVDALSGGRARLGIGAGHARADFEPYGFPYKPVADRIDQMEECIVSMKRLWTDDEVPFPSVVHTPHPPIIVGANTPGRAMRVAVAEADGINTWQLGPDQVADLRTHLDDAGCDFARFELTSDVLLRRGADQEDADKMAKAVADVSTKGGRGPAAARWNSSGVLWGDEAHMAAQVVAFADVGVVELSVSGTFEDAMWFAERVILQLPPHG